MGGLWQGEVVSYSGLAAFALGRGSATKVVAGVARRPMGWLIRPLARASEEARGPGGLRSAAKRKQAGFVHRPEESVGLAG